MTAPSELQQLEKTVRDAPASLFREREPTVFEVGGASYYENPASDMLAFFMNPARPHGLGTLFLLGLCQCFDPAPDIQPRSVLRVLREQTTESGKRPDIIIEGTTWVIFIENKIRHVQNNPFEDYEVYAATQFAGKKAYFIILSPGGRSQRPTRWKGVS